MPVASTTVRRLRQRSTDGRLGVALWFLLVVSTATGASVQASDRLIEFLNVPPRPDVIATDQATHNDATRRQAPQLLRRPSVGPIVVFGVANAQREPTAVPAGGHTSDESSRRARAADAISSANESGRTSSHGAGASTPTERPFQQALRRSLQRIQPPRTDFRTAKPYKAQHTSEPCKTSGCSCHATDSCGTDRPTRDIHRRANKASRPSTSLAVVFNGGDRHGGAMPTDLIQSFASTRSEFAGGELATTPPLPDPATLQAIEHMQRPLDSIGDLTADITLPAGRIPENQAADVFQASAPVLHAAGTSRGWAVQDFHWCATALCHRPLYFEEVNLERYGYTHSHCLQPAISTAHFFATVPALPYKMVANCPWDCGYTLGHYRPGGCAPWQIHWLPLRLDAGIVQGGVVTGLVFLLP